MAEKWTLYLPHKAKKEATIKQDLDAIIGLQVNSGIIKEIHCNSTTFEELRAFYGNLGDGELESIAIAKDCLDKKTASYMILSDDKAARSHAKELGIPSLDILAFFVRANTAGIVSKQKVEQYVRKLASNGYVVRDDVYRLLMKVLV